MRLAEMLSYADIEQLHQLAATYSCECNVNSKNELIQALLASIKRESMIRKQLDELRREELYFLMHIVFDSRTVFTLEDLRAKAKMSYLEELDRDTYRSLISIALKKGWIFRAISRHSGASFQIPEDMRKQWSAAILKEKMMNARIAYELPLYRDEGHAIIEDVLAFIRYVSVHEPPLTADGSIYRRNQQQILELMAVSEKLVEKGGWRFGYGRHFKDYPDRFSLIYDFCFFRGYLNETPGARLTLTPQSDEASQLPLEMLALEMYKFWVRLYKRPIPGLAMFIRMICTATASQWVEEKALLDLLLPRLRPYYYDKEESIALHRILKMMVHLGLISKGTLDQTESFYRTTAWGETVLASVETSAMKAIVLDRKSNRTK